MPSSRRVMCIALVAWASMGSPARALEIWGAAAHAQLHLHPTQRQSGLQSGSTPIEVSIGAAGRSWAVDGVVGWGRTTQAWGSSLVADPELTLITTGGGLFWRPTSTGWFGARAGALRLVYDRQHHALVLGDGNALEIKTATLTEPWVEWVAGVGRPLWSPLGWRAEGGRRWLRLGEAAAGAVTARWRPAWLWRLGLTWQLQARGGH